MRKWRKKTEKVVKKSNTKPYVSHSAFFFQISHFSCLPFPQYRLKWTPCGLLGFCTMSADKPNKLHSSNSLARGLSYAMKQCKIEGEDGPARLAAT